MIFFKKNPSTKQTEMCPKKGSTVLSKLQIKLSESTAPLVLGPCEMNEERAIAVEHLLSEGTAQSLLTDPIY